MKLIKATIKVHVTAEDMKRGKRGDHEKCPVALAVRRAIKKRWVSIGCFQAWPPYVSGFELTVKFRDSQAKCMKVAPLSRAVINKIGRIDDGGPVKPFSFPLEMHRARVVR